MLRVLRQFVHVIQDHFDHRGSLRLLISQEVESRETSAHTIRTLSQSGDAISWREVGFFEADHGKDGLVLNPEDAQRIVDQLWALGHRPSEAVGSAGALTAAHAHLADLRKVVTSLLDDNPLAKLLAAANAMNDRISQFAVSQSLGDTAKVIEDQRHVELSNAIREINQFLRLASNQSVERSAEARERRNERIEEVDAYFNQILQRLSAIDRPRDPLTLDEAFDDPESTVYQALVAKGWTPPQ